MKPRVLFLPGYACTPAIWDRLLPGLADDLQAVCIQWPLEQTRSFHQVADFAAWLHSAGVLQNVDCVVGHSLGGLVAVELALPHASVLLIESFLRPPGPFFQNLAFHPGLPPELTSRLDGQKAHYSVALAESLRQADFSAAAASLPAGSAALYGDRGCGDPARVVAALNWPAKLAARLPVSIAGQSCHFPMLENPAAVQAWLRQCLAVM